MFYDKFLAPNSVVSTRAMKTLIGGQIILFLVMWQSLTPPVIPKPLEVISALWTLLADGFMADLMTSLWLYFEAVVLATVFSLLLSYAAALAFFRPFANGWAKLRFLGLIGLPFLFTLYLSGAHELKLALLTFSISVFLVTGMMDVLDAIPREKYDLARTLRMSEWEVVWEVMIRGRIDVAMDVIRQNAAIGWMAMGLVEGLFRSEGGIGAVLMTQNKHFHLAEVAAIQAVILILGVIQDYGLGIIKCVFCPYARLLLERR